MERCAPLGFLRYISSSQDPPLNLKFEGIKFKNIVDSSTLRIDVDKMVGTVVSNTQRPGLKPQSVAMLLGNAMNNARTVDYHQICCGHDVIELFGLGLRRTLGSQVEAVTTREQLEAAFRLAFEWRDLEKTKLYVSIRDWEERNSPFKVLSE